jgi:uncharacterized membrane protein
MHSYKSPPLAVGATQVLAHNDATDARTTRITAFDILRRLALILMALDHAAYFAGVGILAEFHIGDDLYLEGWPHWVTGLLTNIAAPTFWFLAGVSMVLFVSGRRRKDWTEWEITKFLLIRAGIILLLDLAVGLVWGFSFNVLSSLAVSIAILSIVRLLPNWVIACIGAALIVGYEWLWRHLGYTSQTGNALWSAIWITPNNGLPSLAPFPVLGWIGLMALGYSLTVMLRERRLLQSSWAWLTMSIFLFVVWLVIRLAGGYGNIVSYDPGQPWYYFLAMSKDPISLAYLSFNLAWMCLLLAGLLRFQNMEQTQPFKLARMFGQTSLFFYVTHVVLYRILGIGAVNMRLLNHFGIGRAYLVWAVGLCLLVPLCTLFQYLKGHHLASLLRYV